ncbi:hypothetical protein CQW23_13657 [Capsicum baccatum]|uniref:Pentatricopeptide repeat-containing protein n=1 Tax=Capsicum baccatum TaxID=33114 RepID=A0A2G2WH50_CAPBA|nr:hypothetical protein CQW23_13657 [Capsicum baccatum]
MEQGNTKPDVCIYSIVIDALCKDRNLDAAICILNEMKQKGIPPDIVTYSSLIDGLCKLGQWEKVKTLFSEMVNLNIYPNVLTFSILIDGLCKEGKVEDAEEVMRHMIEKGVEPNAVAKVEKMAIGTPLELSGQASEEESHRTGKIIQVTDIADFMTEEADPDGVQINVHYAFGTQYQHIFSLICHVHHSLMSFVLSHATIRILDLGGGYVEEIGLVDIATYRKDLETLGHFLMRKNRVDLGLHNVLSLEIRDCSFGDKAGGQCCKAGDDTLSLDVFVVSTLWRVFAASSEVAKG